MEVSKYAINSIGKLVYIPTPIGGETREYTIWGIGVFGLLHGAGSFLKRENIPRFVFDQPTDSEINRYYELLDKLGFDDK